MNGKRFESIDIVKGIAMIMVIMVHYQQSFGICRWFRYFQMGVPVFFVCSGFGIMCLINKKYSGYVKGKEKRLSFYYSRFKALAPGWYLAILVIFLTDTVLICSGRSVYTLASSREPFAIVINMAFLHGLVPSCNNTVVPGGWYIGTTAILYFLTPFILDFLQRFKNRWAFFAISVTAGITVWIGLEMLFPEAFSYKDFDYFFFLIHYPEYLLGIMLYEAIREKAQDEKRIRIYLPIGLVVFAVAYALFYSSIPYRGYVSAWTTALATYFALYYLIVTEDRRRKTKIGSVLASFGKNSYGIFLLHVFFAWRFVLVLEKIANRMNCSIKTVPGFVILLPIVLALSYVAGAVFNKVIKKTAGLVFH